MYVRIHTSDAKSCSPSISSRQLLPMCAENPLVGADEARQQHAIGQPLDKRQQGVLKRPHGAPKFDGMIVLHPGTNGRTKYTTRSVRSLRKTSPKTFPSTNIRPFSGVTRQTGRHQSLLERLTKRSDTQRPRRGTYVNTYEHPTIRTAPNKGSRDVAKGWVATNALGPRRVVVSLSFSLSLSLALCLSAAIFCCWQLNTARRTSAKGQRSSAAHRGCHCDIR